MSHELQTHLITVNGIASILSFISHTGKELFFSYQSNSLKQDKYMIFFRVPSDDDYVNSIDKASASLPTFYFLTATIVQLTLIKSQ